MQTGAEGLGTDSAGQLASRGRHGLTLEPYTDQASAQQKLKQLPGWEVEYWHEGWPQGLRELW